MRAATDSVNGSNKRGHNLSVDDLMIIAEKIDSPDYLYSQDSNDRGVAVIKHDTDDGSVAVIVEFDCNINPAYLNNYEAGTYNVAVTTFDVDGGMVGLFEYANRNGWRQVFNKEKEGDPAKKFPATRPFAIEQDSLNESIDTRETVVKKNSAVVEQTQKRAAQELVELFDAVAVQAVENYQSAAQKKYRCGWRRCAEVDLESLLSGI